MGKVVTRDIKTIVEKIFLQYSDKFTENFEENKKILSQFLNISSKKLRNKIAGYITSLVHKRKNMLNFKS